MVPFRVTSTSSLLSDIYLVPFSLDTLIRYSKIWMIVFAGPTSENRVKSPVPTPRSSRGSIRSDRSRSPEVQLSPRRDDVTSPVPDISQ